MKGSELLLSSVGGHDCHYTEGAQMVLGVVALARAIETGLGSASPPAGQTASPAGQPARPTGQPARHNIYTNVYMI